MAKYHKRNKLIHGFQARKHPSYNTWAAMLSRCRNPNNPHFKNYGGRGIQVCPEWLESFERFALDMGLKSNPDLTIERVDNAKGYSPENCVWTDRTSQCLNRRTFKTNSSGETGIHQSKSGSFICRYDEGGKRYNLGRFPTLESAVEYRNRFLKLFESDKAEALKMTTRRARLDSATGIKGISKNEQGYIVRVTLEDGSRKYLGFSKDLPGAIAKLENFKGKSL